MPQDYNMTKELSDLLFQFVGMVNTFWGVYATLTIALIGWVFESKRSWPWQQRAAIAIAYCFGVVINCLAQLRLNGLIRATLSDLKAAMKLRTDMPNLNAEIDQIPTLSPCALVCVYLLVGATLIYLIWNQNRFHSNQIEEGERQRSDVVQ